MKKIIPLIIFIAALVLLQNRTSLHLLINPIDTQQLSQSDVILYSTSWCPYCAKARRFFHQANIPFTEYDIEKSPERYSEYEAYELPGVPLIIIGTTVIQGYDPKAIRINIEKLLQSRKQSPPLAKQD